MWTLSRFRADVHEHSFHLPFIGHVFRAHVIDVARKKSLLGCTKLAIPQPRVHVPQKLHVSSSANSTNIVSNNNTGPIRTPATNRPSSCGNPSRFPPAAKTGPYAESFLVHTPQYT